MSDSQKVTAGEPLKVALLGCGVVGSSVARMLTQHADDLAARVGRPLELIGIAVRRAGKDRSDLPVDPALFTTDAESIITEADAWEIEQPSASYDTSSTTRPSGPSQTCTRSVTSSPQVGFTWCTSASKGSRSPACWGCL